MTSFEHYGYISPTHYLGKRIRPISLTTLLEKALLLVKQKALKVWKVCGLDTCPENNFSFKCDYFSTDSASTPVQVLLPSLGICISNQLSKTKQKNFYFIIFKKGLSIGVGTSSAHKESLVYIFFPCSETSRIQHNRRILIFCLHPFSKKNC